MEGHLAEGAELVFIEGYSFTDPVPTATTFSTLASSNAAWEEFICERNFLYGGLRV